MREHVGSDATCLGRRDHAHISLSDLLTATPCSGATCKREQDYLMKDVKRFLDKIPSVYKFYSRDLVDAKMEAIADTADSGRSLSRSTAASSAIARLMLAGTSSAS